MYNIREMHEINCKIREAMKNPRVKPGEHGSAEIVDIEVTKDQGLLSFMDRGPVGSYCSPGKYLGLNINGQLVMSNTNMEKRTNFNFASEATGEVLVNGLGMGMLLDGLLQNPRVTGITVIEKSQDVIDLVGPYFQDPKITIICDCAYEYKIPKGQKWDCIWHDIWPEICTDNLTGITKLKRKYAKRHRVFQAAWIEDELRSHKRKEDKRSKRWRYV